MREVDGNPGPRALDMKNSDCFSTDLEEGLREFRDSVHAASDRPGSFWERQHQSIMNRLDERKLPAKRSPTLLGASTALVILICCFFLLIQSSKAPTPDLAAGSDQILLIEVERALNRNSAEALAPAAMIEHEFEKVDKRY
jgi:hypothetical protein